MMEAAVSADNAELGPILINPRPETQEAAEANLFAFSNECHHTCTPTWRYMSTRKRTFTYMYVSDY